MRPLLIVLIAVALCVPASARPSLPHIARGVPYVVARERLVEAGFRPVAFSARPSTAICHPGVCRRTPEIYDCGRVECFFLFLRRTDGRFLVVAADAQTYRFHAAHWANFGDLVWFGDQDKDFPYRTVIRSDLGRIAAAAARAEARLPPPPPEQYPLCSDSQGRQPCWVKPPPDYKPPNDKRAKPRAQ